MPEDFTEQDFPIWESYEIYEENYELFRSLTYGYDKETAPSALKEATKYNVFTVWFKIHGNGTIEGPFANKHGKKI